MHQRKIGLHICKHLLLLYHPQTIFVITVSPPYLALLLDVLALGRRVGHGRDSRLGVLGGHEERHRAPAAAQVHDLRGRYMREQSMMNHSFDVGRGHRGGGTSPVGDDDSNMGREARDQL